MSSLVLTFEVRYRDRGYLKMAHVVARDHKQATEKARKFPHVVTVRKVDYLRVFAGEIEGISKRLNIGQPEKTALYPSAIAMDELIWNKNEPRFQAALETKELVANNRVRRRENYFEKDKKALADE